MRLLPAASRAIGDGASQDPLLFRGRQVVQLLGKQCQSLPVGTGKVGQVGAPEHALRPEGVDDPADLRVERRIGVALRGITRQGRGLHHHVGQSRQLDQAVDDGLQRLADEAGVEAHVIDGQPEARVARGSLAEPWQRVRRQGHDRDAVALGCLPEPVRGTVVKPLAVTAAMEGEADPQHTGLILPRGHAFPAFRGVEGQPAHDREPVRVKTGGVQRGVVSVRFPSGRYQHRALNAGAVHLAQQLLVPQRLGAVGLGRVYPVPRLVGGLRRPYVHL